MTRWPICRNYIVLQNHFCPAGFWLCQVNEKGAGAEVQTQINSEKKTSCRREGQAVFPLLGKQDRWEITLLFEHLQTKTAKRVGNKYRNFMFMVFLLQTNTTKYTEPKAWEDIKNKKREKKKNINPNSTQSQGTFAPLSCSALVGVRVQSSHPQQFQAVWSETVPTPPKDKI